MEKNLKQYRTLFENWQRHVNEEEALVAQEPDSVPEEPVKNIVIPAPPPIQNPQMDDEEMDRIMAEVVEGRKIVKEQPLSEKKKKEKKETDPNIPKDAVLGYVCEEVLEKVIVDDAVDLARPTPEFVGIDAQKGPGKPTGRGKKKTVPDQAPSQAYRDAVAAMFRSPQIKNTIIGLNKEETKYKNTIEYVNNLIVFHNAAVPPTRAAMGYKIDVCPVGDLRDGRASNDTDDQYETTIGNLVGNTLASTSGGGTATYDVETDRANLHVKLNQDKAGQRLIGFQRGLDNFTSGLPELRQNSGTLMNRAWSNFLKRYFVKDKDGYKAIVKSINAEMKKQKFQSVDDAGKVTDDEKEAIKEIIIANTITAEGVISKPSGYGSSTKDLTYVLSDDQKGVRIAKRRPEREGEVLITMPYGSAEGWWAFVKNRYKELIKEYMNSDPQFAERKWQLLKYVLGDIKTKLIGQPGLEGDDKVTLFFNYSGGMKKDEEGYKADVELDVNKYRLKGCGADAKDAEISLHFLGLGDPETDKKQPFGLVYSKPPKGRPTDDKGENILFTIEFRTDGEGHPPQLKIGKGLKTAKQKDSDLHKWYRKAVKPEDAK